MQLKLLLPISVRKWWHRLLMKIRYEVKMSYGSEVNKSDHFEGKNALGSNTRVYDSFMGLGSYIANNSVIERTKIGRFCSIGDNVRTCLGIHPTFRYVSTHPAFYSLQAVAGFTFVKEQKFAEHKYIDNEQKYVVEIGNDVWIGNNVMIMDGVRIGDGAIIATGAVVTKDVEPYSIVGGVPAKLIRYRFPKDVIDFLLRVKWWNKDHKWLAANANIMTDIKLFCDQYDKAK